MKQLSILLLFVSVFSSYNQLMNEASAQQEIGFVETFALADDRAQVLKELIPGTEDYYYYHALHYQNTQQLDKVDELLKPWNKRLGSTQRYNIIRNRQAFLKYDNDPDFTFDFLVKTLKPNLNHQRRIPRADRKLPTELDPSLISIERLSKQALSKHSNTDGFEPAGLEAISKGQLNRQRRRHLLSRLQYPDYPNLVELILKDLKERDSGGFGSLDIHNNLTREQLDLLLESQPKLISENNFVYSYVTHLLPGADENLEVDRKVNRDYLKRLWKFTEQLPATFNSLKTCVLYRQLELDRLDGKYNRKLFLEYLKLPKRTGYVNRDLLEKVRSKHIAQLSADYSSQARLAPIYSDEPLVREYLHHFLKDANNFTAFSPYVNEPYLKQQFATVKILHGLGDTERWASMLGPNAYRAIVDRVDLEFAATNTEFFDDDVVVKIDLFTKNIDKLIVKVFEINSFNYYRKHQSEIDTDINLDGLLPNSEQTYEYKEAPALRKQRTFAFEDLKGPGVYVVDFIAGGKSSRALIRRGRLTMSGRPTSAGHVFAVYDHNRKHVKDASLWIAGRKYEASKKTGMITLPYSTQPSRASAIISHKGFSSLQTFGQLEENYQLQAGLYIDRESMLVGKKTQVIVRPSLRINGLPASVKVLEDVELSIVSNDFDGTSTTKRLQGLELFDDSETVCEFVIPPRLSSISCTLTAKVKNLSRNAKITLNQSQTFNLNQIDTTDEIQDVHLMPTSEGYFLEVRGKTGEIRKKQAVRVSLKHRYFEESVNVDLQSDENGLIALGPLQNIISLKTTAAGGSSRSWPLGQNKQTYWDVVHSLQGEEIEIPLPTEFDAGERDFALYERRGSRYTKDWVKKAKIKDGLILLNGLPAGDFVLWLKNSDHRIKIKITDGVAGKNFVAIGKHRHLEVRDPNPLYIKNISADNKNIKINVGNSGKLTRVHLIASRYQPRFDSFAEMARVRDTNPFEFKPSIRRSVYMAGRVIGDEYQYILDRKYANRYPGNMLDRPSFLLAPWAWRDTANKAETLLQGGKFGEVGNDKDMEADRQRLSRMQRRRGYQDFANLDFLQEDATVLHNLKADENGTISIDRKKLAGKQFIRVVAVDHLSTVEKNISLEPTTTKLRDLRLAHALDPDKHFSQSKAIEIVGKAQKLTIEDLVSAKFQHFDDLGDVFRMFLMLNSGTELSTFEFVLSWTDKTDQQKQELYSTHACHELNFYLYKKDKAFFERVIKPHLENKRERTFIDEYLLGSRLEKYLDSLSFEQLNIFEKILLSQRLEKQSPDIVRNLLDQYMLSPTSVTAFDGLYDFAMNSNGLNERSVAGFFFEGEELEKGKNSESFKSLAGDQLIDRLKKTPSKSKKRSGKDSKSGRESAPQEQKSQSTDRKSDSSRPGKRGPGDGGGFGGGGRGGFDHDSDELFFENEEGLRELRDESQSLYRRLPPTREWVEHNYYHIAPGSSTASLVAMNRFWRDYANHDGGGPFLSTYFPECTRSLTEMMFVLAVLDLPEKATEHEFEYADGSLNVTAAGPMIAFHQQVQPAELNDGNTTILVSENFYQKNDRFRQDKNGVQYDKFINDKFLAHTLYGGQVVVTNPTSTPRLVEILVQVPKGSVATTKSHPTRTFKMQLAAFQTSTFDYSFYFPTAGDFDHYPAHVSSDDKVLAVAAPVTFKVSDEPAKLDKSSWEFVSQNGSEDDVIEFISGNNALKIDLSQIAFRLKNKAFFTRIIDVLRNRYVYNHQLWAYAIKHRDANATREYLAHENQITKQVGSYFDSTLLDVVPFDRKWYQHREYSPLVNARFHGLGARRQILNPQFHQQYHLLMDILSHKSALVDDDHLVVTYYMLLQDRIDIAFKHLDKVNESKVETKMQYEYCSAYMDMYLEKPESAAAKAEKWVSYPVDLWRNRFKNILAQVEEIRGGETKIVDDKDQSQQQDKLAAESTSFDFKVEGQKITIIGQNLSAANINFYEMDIELLFSRNPFAQDDFEGFSIIRPNLTKAVKLDTKKATQEFELPNELMNKNVLIEIETGDQVKSKPYFANSLAVQMIERYGQLRVTETGKNKAVPKTYVKVYARGSDGQTRFHKDGYTDLRGRFDYVTQSNNSLDNVLEYSILILSPEYGTMVKKAIPPAE